MGVLFQVFVPERTCGIRGNMDFDILLCNEFRRFYALKSVKQDSIIIEPSYWVIFMYRSQTTSNSKARESINHSIDAPKISIRHGKAKSATKQERPEGKNRQRISLLDIFLFLHYIIVAKTLKAIIFQMTSTRADAAELTDAGSACLSSGRAVTQNVNRSRFKAGSKIELCIGVELLYLVIQGKCTRPLSLSARVLARTYVRSFN
ncbi:hypothetical protein WAI453_013253 [Rhynchosporium graminicola]